MIDGPGVIQEERKIIREEDEKNGPGNLLVFRKGTNIDRWTNMLLPFIAPQSGAWWLSIDFSSPKSKMPVLPRLDLAGIGEKRNLEDDTIGNPAPAALAGCAMRICRGLSFWYLYYYYCTLANVRARLANGGVHRVRSSQPQFHRLCSCFLVNALNGD
jgi:hypothetical protein